MLIEKISGSTQRNQRWAPWKKFCQKGKSEVGSKRHYTLRMAFKALEVRLDSEQAETIHSFCPSISRDTAVLLLPERLQGSTLKDNVAASSRETSMVTWDIIYILLSLNMKLQPHNSLTLIYLHKVTKASNRSRAKTLHICYLLFLQTKNCFQIAPTFAEILNQRRGHSGDKYVYLANIFTELGTRDECIKLGGSVHFTCLLNV